MAVILRYFGELRKSSRSLSHLLMSSCIFVLYPTKFQPSSKLAITILDSFVVCVLTLIPPQRAPLPNFCHITHILRSLHWLKIAERIEYKLLSLTYKVLTTTQPSYLHHLIAVQPPRSTRSVALRLWSPSLDHEHHPRYV